MAMDDAPAESHAEMPAHLRQRMLNRASTLADGGRPATPNSPKSNSPKSNSSNSPNSPRRRSSLLSTRSSTDSLRILRNHDLDRAASPDAAAWLQSSPVLIAIVPAAAALIHPQGGTFATDLVLLVLSACFLAKCGSAPWHWYMEAQQRRYISPDDQDYADAVVEEEASSSDAPPESAEPLAGDAKHVRVRVHDSAVVDHDRVTSASARSKLKQWELVAFASCFLAPMLGAYVVHYLRSQFTHRARDGIVTDLNLFFYVCISQVRPTRQFFDMISQRTLHLQRLVIAEPLSKAASASAQRLPQRLAALETRLETPASHHVDVNKITNEVRQSMQHQLDALNRAVRKYEKKQLAQTMQIEARFHDIDVRLRDTLSLAASAARTGQKPGIVSTTLSWASGFVAYAMQAAWDMATYPFRVASSIVDAVKISFSREQRYTARRSKASLAAYPAMPSTSRMQSKSGR
ncbi:hypothetical protein ACEQ8H_000441 [Pleosporales sp. CAS-2024a]